MIATRENMTPELKRELELIEAGERKLLVKNEIYEAIESHELYIASTYNQEGARCGQSINPFEMRLHWEDLGRGPGLNTVMTFDFKNEILELLDSYQCPSMHRATVQALRKLADEIELEAANLDE